MKRTKLMLVTGLALVLACTAALAGCGETEYKLSFYQGENKDADGRTVYNTELFYDNQIKQGYMQKDKIVWRVKRTEKHGIENYPFGERTVSLICAARANGREEPQVEIRSDAPVTVEIVWEGGSKTLTA